MNTKNSFVWIVSIFNSLAIIIVAVGVIYLADAFDKRVDSWVAVLESQGEVSRLQTDLLIVLSEQDVLFWEEVRALKDQPAPTADQGPIVDLNPIESRLTALEAANVEPVIPSFLEFKTRRIGELMVWGLDERECSIGMGISVAGTENTCIMGYTDVFPLNGKDGQFLVLAEIFIQGELGLELTSDVQYLLVTVDLPAEFWFGAVDGAIQSGFQEAMGWTAFENGELPAGTHIFALKWWPVSEVQAEQLLQAGWLVTVSN